jgi:hypothetical protein
LTTPLLEVRAAHKWLDRTILTHVVEYDVEASRQAGRTLVGDIDTVEDTLLVGEAGDERQHVVVTSGVVVSTAACACACD